MSSSVDFRPNWPSLPSSLIDCTREPHSYPGVLGAAATPIIGREDEVRTIMGLLQDTDVRLITLTGPAGVGKTRLAEEIVQRVRRLELSPDGVCSIPLQSLRDADLVVPVIASAIGLAHPVEGDTLARLITEIDQRQILLVLDSVEQVVESASRLSHLLAACPALRILVASRRALHVRAEHIVVVAPLALPVLDPASALADVERSPAVQCFLHLVRARRREFSITPDNASVVASICHRLDGLPLALELAAARMDVLSPESLLRQLKDGVDILVQGPVDLPVRHRRMHDAIAGSYELLTAVEQRWFRQLSVLEGPFEVATMRDIGDPSPSGDGACFDILLQLVRASLVIPVRDEGSAGPRFRMLETIRTFGMSLLSDAVEIEGIRRRYAVSIADRISALDETDACRVIEANYAGLRAALTWSWNEQDDQLFLQLIRLLEPYWRRSGPLDEGWLWMERAVALTRKQGRRSHDGVHILLGASTLARRRADFRTAECLALEGLREAERNGDAPHMARALNALGAIATQQSDPERACVLYRRALKSYRQTNDSGGAVVVQHNIALATLGQYDIDRAIQLWEGAIPEARRVDKKNALIAILRSLGAVRLAQGRTDCANRILREALSWSEREHDPFSAALCHVLLARACADYGDSDKEALHGEEALKAARKAGEPVACVLALISRANVERGRGAPETAHMQLNEAHEIASAVGAPLACQPVFQAMGELRRSQGEWRGAFHLYEESLRCWLQGGDVLDLIPLLVPFADVASKLGHDAPARRMFQVVQVLRAAGLDIPVVHRSIYQEHAGSFDQALGDAGGEHVTLTGQRLREMVGRIFFDAGSAPLLSDRERTVLGLLAEGYTNAHMAERLFVSPHTINTHVRRIYQKIGVNSRSSATRYALQHGVVVGVRHD